MDGNLLFRLGPDQTDIRKRRPYFLVPVLHPRLDEPLNLHADNPEEEQRLGEADKMPTAAHEEELLAEETRRAFWRVAKYIRAAERDKKPITDVFVVSHGWHRNFYGAVAAYDRIISRIALLQKTGRLKPQPKSPEEPDSPEAPPDFHPLFLTVHWHSDPGQNGWVDKCGRRHKASFIKNAMEVFNPEPDRTFVQANPAENFIKDFERLYEMMAQISAPGVDALSSSQMNEQCFQLSQMITQYSLREAPNITDQEKVAIAWACYHEAQPKRILLPQKQNPGDVIGFRQAVSVALKFAVGALGLMWVLGKTLSFNVTGVLSLWLNNLAFGMEGNAAATTATQVLLGVFLFLAFVTSLPVAKRWHDDWASERKGNADGSPLTEVGSRLHKQAYLQMAFAVVLMFSLFAFIINGDFHRLALNITEQYESSVAVPAAAFIAANTPQRLKDALDKTGETLQETVPKPSDSTVPSDNRPNAVKGNGSPMQPSEPPKRPELAHYAALYLAAFSLAALYLIIFSIRQQSSSAVRGMPILAVICWLLVEIPIALPIALWLTLTYFFGWLMLGIGWVFNSVVQLFPQGGFLFNERLGQPNHAPQWRDRRGTGRLLIGRIASLPIFFLQKTVPEDSGVAALMDTINSQLAFYEMQRKGVEVGARAAQFISGLYSIKADDDSLNPILYNARLHLLGHSFGSLVVVNMARHLSWEYDAPPRCANNHFHFQKGDGKIDSLSLLQGASASSWFNGEVRMLQNIGVLACVYSQYDSANGFLYPLANRGRLAAGNVGLSRDLSAFSNFPCYASLVRPPDITEMLDWKEYEEERKRDGNALILNIDASRMIYEGSVAAGGGHDDIFKDEVVHLLWSVLKLTWRK